MSENIFSSFRLTMSEIIPQPQKAKKLTKRSAFFTLEIHFHWIFYLTLSSWLFSDEFLIL